MSVTYRPSLPADCLQVAELLRQASSGTVDYLFGGLVPGASTTQIVASGLENPTGPHSHANVIVAADGFKILGMVLAFASAEHCVTTWMREFIPAERLAHFNDFYAARVDNSWYVDALCVSRAFRRLGMGSALLEGALDRGRGRGFGSASLLVFADNLAAIALYERFGFETLRSVRLEPTGQITGKGGCLLMRRDL